MTHSQANYCWLLIHNYYKYHYHCFRLMRKDLKKVLIHNYYKYHYHCFRFMRIDLKKGRLDSRISRKSCLFQHTQLDKPNPFLVPKYRPTTPYLRSYILLSLSILVQNSPWFDKR
ncbi:Uncharacterized protein TCM_031722 [Theobroma cacao]|uniref:Uncharacterized protein n=1 Tax=Theobroma cacao TaxID=3641 RepID=A0A061F797_THECC|nr:Uncharacterized protein TCM_031722 [Theobroma cacao]